MNIETVREYCLSLPIEPAWHWNKKFWNQMNVEMVNEGLLTSLINHSYAEVVKKLTKKVKTEYPEITTIL